MKKNESIIKFLYAILLANVLLFAIYMVAYLYFKEPFGQMVHIPFWRDILEVFWPSAIDIITGMRVQIGEDSACMYYVYTLVILSLNVVVMSAYTIYLMINAKKIRPEKNININKDYLKNSLVVLLLMVLFILGMFFIDEYNYGDEKYTRSAILKPSSAWGGVWNFFRTTISLIITSTFILVSITMLAIYINHRDIGKNTNGKE